MHSNLPTIGFLAVLFIMLPTIDFSGHIQDITVYLSHYNGNTGILSKYTKYSRGEK